MGVLDTLKGLYEGAKATVQGPAQEVSDSAGLPNLTPPVPAEPTGMTTTGGKMCGGRRRKTRRGKKSKKTLRRRR